jgi:hypothetical protein
VRSIAHIIDAIRGKKADGTQYDLASEEGIAELNVLLTQIDDHLDNIKIEAESVNLNTDEIEDKLDAVKAAVDALKGPAPDEKHLADLHAALLDVKTAIDEQAIAFPDDFPLPASQLGTLLTEAKSNTEEIATQLAQSLHAQQKDATGASVVSSRHNLHEFRFFEHPAEVLLDIESAGTGTTSKVNGHARFTTGETAGGSTIATTPEGIRYSAFTEFYFAFSAEFSEPSTGNGIQAIGAHSFETGDGYGFVRTAAGMNILWRKGGTVMENVPQAEWNGQLADFTRDGETEEIDWEKNNVFVISGVWLGGGPVTVWALKPDANNNEGSLVPLHTFRHTNKIDEPATTNPNFGLQAIVANGSVDEEIFITSGCWAMGTNAPTRIPYVSTSNSTTTIPEGEDRFPGRYLSAMLYPAVSVFLKSNVPGTLRFHESRDAENDDRVTERAYAPGDGAQIYDFMRRLEFVRVEFEPLGDDPENLVLQTTFLSTDETIQRLPLAPMINDMARNSEGMRVKAGLFTLNENTGPPGAPPRFIPHRGTEEYGPRVDVKRSVLPNGAATDATVASLLTESTFAAEDFAQETTLEAARSLISSLDTKFDVDLSTLATEDTVATLLTEATFNAEDFATQATLEAARVLLASLDGKDFATQTTLAAVLSELESQQKDALTDTQLRASPVGVDTGLDLTPLATAQKQTELNETLVNIFTANQDDHPIELDISEVYVTQWYDTHALGRNINGAITANQMSALGGLRSEWSNEGTEGDDDPPQFPPGEGQTVVPGVTADFAFAAGGPRYVRFRYQNGNAAATVLGVVSFSHFAVQAPSAPLGSTLTALSLASTSRAVIGGMRDNNMVQNVSITDDGRIRTVVTELLQDILLRPLSTGRSIHSETVGTTATRVDDGLAGRRSIGFKAICEEDETIVLVSGSSGTTSNGWTLFRGDTETIMSGPEVEWWAVASKAGQRLDVMEVA